MRLLFFLLCSIFISSCTVNNSSLDTILFGTATSPTPKYVSSTEANALGLVDIYNFGRGNAYERTSEQVDEYLQNDYLNCADFSSSAQAQRQFISSGGPIKDPHRLDADGDGFACEFDPRRYTTVKENTYKQNYSSNCHWVNGYRRKDGTYVKGHRRCR